MLRRAPGGRGFSPAAKRAPTFSITYLEGINYGGAEGPALAEARSGLSHQPARLDESSLAAKLEQGSSGGW
jgi:hypothetical protein